MGNTTDFTGSFELNKKLELPTHTFLVRLNETRRVARNVDSKYGTEGEFYIEAKEENIIDYNRPPSTQPSLWCQWKPSDDGCRIEWDGGEKFYNYIEWIQYIIEKILKPKSYILNGVVEWKGEEDGDTGLITVHNNEVSAGDLAPPWQHGQRYAQSGQTPETDGEGTAFLPDKPAQEVMKPTRKISWED